MEFVVNDTVGKWYFDGDRTYLCTDGAGKVLRKIYKEYIPDPIGLWLERCKEAGIDKNSDAGKQLKASPITVKLWEHANAN